MKLSFFVPSVLSGSEEEGSRGRSREVFEVKEDGTAEGVSKET